MNKVEIYIGDPANYSLDVGDFDMSYNYSFNDIRDITKRNSSYSKTITLPGTKNNNFVLGGLFDINSDYSLFNPNIKVDAKVMVNTSIVMEGFMVLNSIDKLNNVDSQGNSIFYNVTIFSKTVDLLEKIGEKYLSECFDLDKYNHTFDIITISDSWQHTYEDGYVYPLMYNGDSSINSTLSNIYTSSTSVNAYRFNNFYPSLFYKAALDAILTEAGFGWEGSFKTNPQFEKEIIPFTGGEAEVVSPADIRERYVEVERTTPSIFDNMGDGNSPSIGIGDEFLAVQPWINIPCNTVVQDASGQYDLAQLEIDFQFDLECKLEIQCVYDIQASTQVTQQTGTGPDRYAFDLVFDTIVRKPNLTFTVEHRHTVSNIEPPITLNSGNTTFRVNNIAYFKTGTLNIEQGDSVYVIVKGIYVDGKQYTDTSGQTNPINYNISFKNRTYIKTIIKPTLFLGANIELRRFFTYIKQKDLITDLIKRYNLIITPDPNNPNVLIFDTYKGYFENNTELLDWSGKKDYSKEDNIEFLQELQNNNILFSYTKASDTDLYNQRYFVDTNDVYGQLEVTIPNANTGTTEIKTPFEPTPLIPSEFGAFTPAISANLPTGKARVLYYGGLKDMIGGGTFTIDGLSFLQYPYAGHFDDPIAPTLDLNFGVCEFYFYEDLLDPPVNNQYTTYWQGYLNQINEGKLLTAYFHLTELDIEKIRNKLSYKVWVKDNYYYINKVVDYNPMNNEPTKVELLKINDLGVYSDINADDLAINTASCPTDLFVQQQTLNGVVLSYYSSLSNTPITQNCCNELGGNWDAATNTCFVRNINLPTRKPVNGPVEKDVYSLETRKFNIGSDNKLLGEVEELFLDPQLNEYKLTTNNLQFTFGNDNSTIGNSTFVIGDDNSIFRDGVSLINSSNNIVEALNVTALGVSNQTLVESNSLYFGNAIRVNTLTGQYYVNGVEVDVAHKISRRITAAEIGELATTPIQLVPEVGTGKYPIIEDAAVYLGEGTLYDEDHTLEIYVDGAEHIYYEIENILANGTPNGIYHLDYHLEKHPDKTPYTHTILNGGIFIKNSVDVTGGDLDIIVTVHYRIVDINNI
jgi:hypothetical protein